MNSKILVVIDNIIQYEKIKKIINIKNIDRVFDFKHSNIKSAIWDHPDFKNKSESIIDVNSNIKYILKNYNLIISVHCFQFFSPEIVNAIRFVNIHPGYNPINRGWYPQVFAIVNNLQIGATIHEMDSKLDNGPIICREFVEKYPNDTSFSLYNRVLEKEIYLFDKYFFDIINNDYKTIVPENSGNIFSKKDFNNLLEFDLNEKASFKVFYDRMRALSHNKYKNSYFIDPNSGKKIFFKIDIN